MTADEGVLIEAGDVVQIDPLAHPVFAGCYATVTEVRSWGVIADVLVPAAPIPGTAPMRLRFEEFAWIGKAAWTPEEEP